MNFKATTSHLALWVERSKPAWAKDLHLPVIATVDGIINARAGIKFDITLCNALSLLSLVHRNHVNSKGRNPTMVQYMKDFREDSAAASCKRGKHYARWARRARRSVKPLA